MKTKSAKSKGRALQNKIASDIQNLTGLDGSQIKGTPMGQTGADIQMTKKALKRFPFKTECKRYASFSVYTHYEQACRHEGDAIPLLVIQGNRKRPLAILDWDDFLLLIQGVKDANN